MIKIELKLFVTLSEYLPESGEHVEILENSNLNDLISFLDIPDDSVKLIFVNGKMQNRNYILAHNDRVGLFPPVGGG